MSHNFCSNCGASLEPGSEYCSSCGKQIAQPTYQPPPPAQPAYQPPFPTQQYSQQPIIHYAPPPTGLVRSQKSPGVALIISFFLPGIGTLYAGKAVRGIVIFVIAFVTIWFLVGILVWLFGMYDAYDTATQYNKHLQQYGQPPNW